LGSASKRNFSLKSGCYLTDAGLVYVGFDFKRVRIDDRENGPSSISSAEGCGSHGLAYLGVLRYDQAFERTANVCVFDLCLDQSNPRFAGTHLRGSGCYLGLIRLDLSFGCSNLSFINASLSCCGVEVSLGGYAVLEQLCMSHEVETALLFISLGL
jgi:hypothetical protein